MNKVSWLVKASAVATLTAIIAVTSFASGTAIDVAAVTPAATKAVEIKLDTLCVAPPTPTPAPTTPAPEATMAATMAAAPATMAATMAAAPATMAATKVATVAATKVPPTAVPPTATPIVKGKVPAWMGVTLTLNKGFTRGGKACVRIAALTDGGPAAAAGLKAQDLILGVDNVVIKELPDLYDIVATKKSGDTVEVTYQRAGKATKVKVTLGLNPTVVELTPAK
jgi:predicted metalloprotease with PDZ domain